MNFTIKDIRTLCDSEGKRIFDFPAKTHLDIIIPDIWNIIAKYLTHSFYLGEPDEKYPDYRMMTIGEFNACGDIFFSYYFSNNVLLGLAKFLFGDILVVDNHYFMNKEKLRCIYCAGAYRLCIRGNGDLQKGQHFDIENIGTINKNHCVVLMIPNI
jgi:hypothetical protein